MQLVAFNDEEKYIRDFLKLPTMLYSSKENMEDPDSMRSILNGTHPLSSYFSLTKFLVYDGDEVKGRFCFTRYDGDDVAYLGFFECVDDGEVAKFLFEKAYEKAREMGAPKIVGPVDGSFWIKYRLKINMFERPYTGEPYNKDYYLKLFRDNGYEVCEHYTSNINPAIDDSYVNEKFQKHYDDFISKGYEIRSPRKEEFDGTVDIIYELVTKLYRQMPIFRDLSLQTFREVFGSYKKIIDPDMTKIAYYEGKAVGFYVSIPDFGNSVYHLGNPLNIIRVLTTKKNPKKFIMLYMGVLPEHRGLGKAISYAIMKELRQNRKPSISALIRDGNINQKYVEEDIKGYYEYVLLSRTIRG